MSGEKTRCGWVTSNPLMIDYHDREWGQPMRDNHRVFELLALSVFQIGLAWEIVLNKRAALRLAFDDFEPNIVAGYGTADVERIAQLTAGIRNRRKIEAVTMNAKASISLAVSGYESLSDYVWSTTGDQVVCSHRAIRATSIEGDNLALDMKKRGFRMVGPRVCHAFLQSIGVMNAHANYCYLYAGRR